MYTFNIIWFSWGENQTFLQVINSDGTYTFLKGKYVIDVKLGQVENDNSIQIYESNNTGAQKFYLKEEGDGYVSIHFSLNGDYVIDVPGGSPDNCNRIILFKYHGRANQKFKFISV